MVKGKNESPFYEILSVFRRDETPIHSTDFKSLIFRHVQKSAFSRFGFCYTKMKKIFQAVLFPSSSNCR